MDHQPIKADTKNPGMRNVHKCNFRMAGQLSNENRRTLTLMHETFARATANILALHLRVPFEMKLAGVDQITFADFADAVREINYVVPLRPGEMNINALFQVEHRLVCSIVDILLGGSGNVGERKRELTEIDENIMEVVANVIARQLENAWQALAITVSVQRCIEAGHLEQQFAAVEKMLLLTFEVQSAATSGKMHLLVPSTLINLLLRQSFPDPQKKLRSRNFGRVSLRERLLDCEFQSSVCLPRLPVAVRELLALAPGTVLKLKVPVKNASAFMLEGREIFAAIPVRSGAQRAAQLVRPASPTSREDELV